MLITKHTGNSEIVLTKSVHLGDDRGYFTEVYNVEHDSWFFPDGVKQISRSKSKKNVFRGFHIQLGMSKLIRVLRGSIYLVNIDTRPSTIPFIYSTLLTESNNAMCYASGVIARGFLSLEDDTIVEYLQSDVFKPAYSHIIKYNDEQLDTTFLGEFPIMSDKDAKEGMALKEFQQNVLAKHPKYSTLFT